MKTLLEAFAKVIGEIGLELIHEQFMFGVQSDGWAWTLRRDGKKLYSALDIRIDETPEQAAICFNLLDAMESRGYAVTVGSFTDENGNRVDGYGCEWYDTENCLLGSNEGCATRLEAVLKAATSVCEALRDSKE